MSVTVFTEEIFDTFRTTSRGDMFFHGHTFTANPLGCAVALASLDVGIDEDTPGRFEAIGTRIEAALRSTIDDADALSLRRFGGIVALDLPDDEAGYLSARGPALKAACRELAPDVLLRPLGNVLYAMPPACTSPAECDQIAARMTDVCAAVRAGGVA